jgi:hypothetical protein
MGGQVVHRCLVADTAALRDRRLHHSHVIAIKGDCYRLKDKRRAGLIEAKNSTPDKGGVGQD